MPFHAVRLLGPSKDQKASRESCTSLPKNWRNHTFSASSRAPEIHPSCLTPCIKENQKSREENDGERTFSGPDWT